MTYETPDQTPIRPDSYEDLIMMKRHESYMDAPGSKYRPNGGWYLSNWYLTLFLGNFTDFDKMTKLMSQQELGMKLKQREGILQRPVILLPVLGAQMFPRERFGTPPFFNQPRRDSLRQIEFR